ncbi:hypothetical protein Tsubulata_015187 [Turnera subulata]|uniref:Uncharacterized protein n=1 Tax=Turnera subulata TaxID=218843 RepID=A0A9Q0F770_9ROSI|nr:hypothetical protein Tsubulata_015187 [Turnera subulata]
MPATTESSSLPLTFLDLFWFKIPPVKRIFFYQLTESTPDSFHSVILPRLKKSLSFALGHFLPLSGTLAWPPHASKPFVLYSPGNGSVSLTVAESHADFSRLSGDDQVREAVESHPYIPELAVSDSAAPVIALQITLFPNQGFCIGVCEHQAIVDTKSTIMFIRAWAHICKNMKEEEAGHHQPSLLTELTPVFDREVIQDPEDIASEYLKNWSELKLADLGSNNPKSLKLLPLPGSPPDKVRTTIELSGQDIKRLREKLLESSSLAKDQLSTFVIAFAYTVVCILRAKGLESETRIIVGFPVDCRSRLEPPIPENYFGNCVSIHRVETQAAAFIGAGGLVSGLMEGVEKGRVLEGAKEKLAKFFSGGLVGVEKIGVAGSIQLEVYSSDFGWGRPRKVEITSIDGGGSISMAESRDGSGGGVELGLVLKRHEMELFRSLFQQIEQIFCYEFTELTLDLFRSTILPRLKHSLSFTLLHFLPLAGNLTWPSHASKPFLLYTPGDGVALTVAESDADFHRLSGHNIQGVEESFHYAPELPVTDSAASVLALQITYFPNQGFCIGVSAQHAIFDGKSNLMFLKAWAHLCRQLLEADGHPSLSPELIPCLDRTLVQDPEDLASLHVDRLLMQQKSVGKDSNPKSLKLMPSRLKLDSTDKVRATFRLSGEDIKKIRERVISELDKAPKGNNIPLHFSTFVITYAYTLVCIMRAKGLAANNKKVVVIVPADCRARFEPPLPANYFGNCVIGCHIVTEAKSVLEEKRGLAFLAKELSMGVTMIQKRSAYALAKERLITLDLNHPDVEVFGITGSTRFDIYGTDFGWGRPKKVDAVSTDVAGVISVRESRDGSAGGVEIGVALKEHQMQIFCSLFASGLESQTN